MGLFEQVKGVFGDDVAVEHTLQLVGESGELLERIVQRLQESGLGEKVQSWISPGENEPLSGAEVQQVFGTEIERIATSAGVSPQEAADEVAIVLPGIVDRLTPNGELPHATTEPLSPIAS
jgi:uncharacterized protein YidB (DUF937 family)